MPGAPQQQYAGTLGRPASGTRAPPRAAWNARPDATWRLRHGPPAAKGACLPGQAPGMGMGVGPAGSSPAKGGNAMRPGAAGPNPDKFAVSAISAFGRSGSRLCQVHRPLNTLSFPCQASAATGTGTCTCTCFCGPYRVAFSPQPCCSPSRRTCFGASAAFTATPAPQSQPQQMPQHMARQVPQQMPQQMHPSSRCTPSSRCPSRCPSSVMHPQQQMPQQQMPQQQMHQQQMPQQQMPQPQGPVAYRRVQPLGPWGSSLLQRAHPRCRSRREGAGEPVR